MPTSVEFLLNNDSNLTRSELIFREALGQVAMTIIVEPLREINGLEKHECLKVLRAQVNKYWIWEAGRKVFMLRILGHPHEIAHDARFARDLVQWMLNCAVVYYGES